MRRSEYSVLHHNCHMAQESTRLYFKWADEKELTYKDYDKHFVDWYRDW